MPRVNLFPVTIGVRLSLEDCGKLHQMCAATGQTPSDLMRELLRRAGQGAAAPDTRGTAPAYETFDEALDGASLVR